MKDLLIRYGDYSLSFGPCPTQKRFATVRNGNGRTFWAPGLSLSVWRRDKPNPLLQPLSRTDKGT